MHLGRTVKSDPALAPFFEFGQHILGQKNNLSGPVYELLFFRIGFGSHQRESCSAIRGSNSQPAIARRKDGITGQGESKLVQIELEASILIANENTDSVQTEVGIHSIRPETTPMRPMGRKRGAHPRIIAP